MEVMRVEKIRFIVSARREEEEDHSFAREEKPCGGWGGRG